MASAAKTSQGAQTASSVKLPLGLSPAVEALAETERRPQRLLAVLLIQVIWEVLQCVQHFLKQQDECMGCERERKRVKERERGYPPRRTLLQTLPNDEIQFPAESNRRKHTPCPPPAMHECVNSFPEDRSFYLFLSLFHVSNCRRI